MNVQEAKDLMLEANTVSKRIVLRQLGLKILDEIQALEDKSRHNLSETNGKIVAFNTVLRIINAMIKDLE
jgi:hypothetical protein